MVNYIKKRLNSYPESSKLFGIAIFQIAIIIVYTVYQIATNVPYMSWIGCIVILPIAIGVFFVGNKIFKNENTIIFKKLGLNETLKIYYNG